jgi:hypothetical protein
MQNVKAGFGILRYGAIALLAIFAFTVFCAWPTPASLFFWEHLHEAESSALATWISAISSVITALATIFLLRGLWLTKESMEEAKRTDDEAKRTALLGLMNQRFNAPNLRFARAVLAKTHLGRKRDGGIGVIKDRYVPHQGWQVINFLNEVGHLVQSGRLDIEDVELAFGTHIQTVGGLWKGQFDQDFRDSRYRPFLSLYEKVMSSPLPKAVRSELDLFFDEAFWEGEEALDSRAKSEDLS